MQFNKIRELEEVIKKRREEYGRPLIFVFSSFIHGAGKSFLIKKFSELLTIKHEIVKVGKIFREIAKEKEISIEDLAKSRDYETDLEIDRRILRKIESLEQDEELYLVLVDSSVAPYYLSGDHVIKILVSADLDVIARRVFEKPREADPKYDSVEDAKRSLLKRSVEDLKRFEELSKYVRDPFWKEVYKKASNPQENLEEFDILLDNSGSIEETIKNLVEGLLVVLK